MRNLRRLAIALLICVVPFALPPSNAAAAVFVSVTVAPPPLPVYVQPPIPAPGYVWVPGYWAWGPGGYYWVPGTWVLPSAVGLLWTPGWWAFGDGAYIWRSGYWGPEVGYYGGVVYGFGYTGYGFDGCYWRGGRLFYNRAVTNITNVNIVNVYNRTVVSDPRATRVSYHGGPGGTTLQATAQQRAAANRPHVAATNDQMRQQRLAQSDHMSFAAQNHGRPTVAATPRPGVFNDAGVTHARNAPASNQQPARTGRPSQVNRAPAWTPQANHGPASPRQVDHGPAVPPQVNRGAAPPPHVAPPQQATVPRSEPSRGPYRGPPAAPYVQRPFQPPPAAHAIAPHGAPQVQQAMPPGGWAHPAAPPRGAPAGMPMRPSGGAPQRVPAPAPRRIPAVALRRILVVAAQHRPSSADPANEPGARRGLAVSARKFP